nr:MAG TPA: hypothetical protein [Caudoviricetes sp.]
MTIEQKYCFSFHIKIIFLSLLSKVGATYYMLNL